MNSAPERLRTTRPRDASETPLARFLEALAAASEAGNGLASAELPDALSELERLRLVLDTARVEAASHSSRESVGTDRVLNIHDAAARLNLSKSYLYREARRLPFTVRTGRSIGFSARGIEDFIRRGGAS